MQESKSPFSIEEFIGRRLKVGKSHYKELITLALVQINDGVQAITISLLTPILEEQLNLTQKQVSFLTSIFYIGVGIGAILSGFAANIYGRRKILILGSIIQFISSVMLAFNFSYSWLYTCRLIYGIGFGSTFAVATVLIAQLMPMNLRGKTLLLINFVNSIGKLGSIACAFIFIEGDNKQISQYMFVSAALNLLAVVLALNYVKQSFRFLLFKKRFQQTFQICNQIIRQNNSDDDCINEQQKESLMKWTIQTFHGEDSNMNTFRLIMQQKRKLFLLSLSIFCINFIFYGEMFIIPFMVGNEAGGLTQYFWMTLGQLPAFLLTYTLIDRWGRKKSLILFFTSAAVLCLLTIQFFNSITLFFTKMFMKAIFQMMTPFALQSYPTSIRSIAYSFNSFCGRIGATIMPFILYPLYNFQPKSPFLFLGFLSSVGALTIMAIRKDTLGKPLDESIEMEDISDNDKTVLQLTQKEINQTDKQL